MKKKMTKIICFLLAALMCVGIAAGCNNKPSDPTATKEPGKTTDQDPDPTEEPDDGKMKITLKDDQNSEKVITDKKIDTPSSFKDNGGKFTISAIYGNHMVLQANMNVRIFGKHTGSDEYVGAELTKKDSKETRYFYGKVENGEFEIWLGTTNYGGPYTLTIFDKDGNSVKFDDVLFGEVYVLGGQSNMGWALGQCYVEKKGKLLYQDLINSTNNDNVRYMGMWPKQSQEYVEYVSSTTGWQSATSSTVPGWSAVGYFFAMRMNEIYGIPVGVVSSCMGGTGIDRWYTEEKTGDWYRGTTHPIRKMTFRGVCWYQGEGDFSKYSDRLTKLIGQWRTAFENPNLYWAAVEMPRYQNADAYYQCREEVKKLYGVVDKYTYCVTLDTGLFPEFAAKGDELNADGIHPYDKQKVGQRLADACAQDFYGAEGTWKSPYAVSAEVKDGKVLVTFENVGDGMTVVGLLKGFEVAGTDRKYKDATPEVVGKNQILLTCDEVTTIWGVRYGRKNYRGDGITSASDSACCYNTVNGEAAYPLEQFVLSKLGG